MQELFSPQYQWLWAAVLVVALFFPVRSVIWVMSVRNHIRKGGEENVSEEERFRLKRRAGFTAAFLCFLFAVGYVKVLFAP